MGRVEGALGSSRPSEGVSAEAERCPAQVRQPAACHPRHAPPEPAGGSGGPAPSGRPQRLAPAPARAGWALGGRPQGIRHGAGAQRPHPVQVRPTSRGWGGRRGRGAEAGLTRLCPMQGGGAWPGVRHRACAAAALPVPCALPSQLRAARRGARPAAAGGAALRRLWLRAPRDGDCAPGAARALMVSVYGAGGAGNRATPQPVPMCMPRSRRTSSVWPATGCYW